MDQDILRIEKRGQVGVLILNRPEKRNALSAALMNRLYQALQDLSREDQVRALVIRGAGDQAFCAGFDLTYDGDQFEVSGEKAAAHPLERALRAIEDFPYPVFAMLNGATYGGGYELAVCCDIRIAADDIKIAVSAVKLGIVYPWQGLRRFVQLLGPAVAKQLLFTGRTFQGTEIARMGLVDFLVTRGELEDLTYKIAGEVAANAPLALRGNKRALNLVLRAWSLSDQERAESESLTAQSWQGQELSEARAAFLEKRGREK